MKKKCFIKKITSFILSASMMVTLVPSYNASKTFAADTFDEEGRYVSDLPIEKVEGLSEDFCMGADVSSAQALIDAGVRYVNIDGQEQDLYELMADAGLNYVRLRLWNDPYLSTETSKTVGNSYGGGVCDINYVKKMALAAQSAGLNVLLDFHYSDFWADPGKQKRPKAWKNLSNDQVVQKVYDFTYESLNILKNAGVKNITMVQVGNETTSQICGFDIHGEYGYKAFAKGCEAIRKYNSENGTNIKSVIHYTNESNFNFKNEAQGLVNKGVDFDIFASSFYPEYSSHGDIDGICENLEGAGTVVNKKTNKNIEVMIAEVGYRYTGNSADANGVYAKYDRTEEGMAIFMRDLIAKVNEIGGIGVFYWEPAWVDVGLDYNKTGTGWASDNAKEYDSGAANGGGKCATTDLAMFKAAGGLKIKAMEALNVYKYVYKGTTSAKDTKNFAPVILEIEKGSDFNNDSMPEKVKIELKSLKMIEKSVEWNQDEIASVDTNNISDYTIEGTVEGYGTVYATVEVVMKEENYLSAVFRTYYNGEGKIAVTFADDIDGLEKDLTINGKSAYYMNEDLSYGENWYKLRMRDTYGKFDIYEVLDGETNLLYSTTDNDFRNITLNNTPYYYDGSLFANTTELMKDVKKIKFTFYVYGIGRNELSLMFANTVKNAGNPFTISGWTGKRFYSMKDASDELGEGWFKLELSTIDGTFQLYDTSSGHADNTIKWIKNFGLDGGGDAYEEVLNGYAYFVISDGKLYRDPLDTGKYIIGALDKPVVTFATSQKENTFIINWTDVENASEYEVTVGGNTIADLRADKNTYEFTAQYTGSNRINVIAKAKGYTSGKSVSAVAYVPDEIVSVSATRSSDTKANVKWNITSGGECDGFIVYKKKETGDFTKVASVASTAKNLDVVIDKSDDYSFKVVPFADNTFGYVYGKSITCKLTSANVAVKNGPNAGTKIKDKVFTYKVTKVAKSGVAGEVAVTGIINKKAKKAVIANEVTIGGFKYKVTSISNNAFKKLKKLSKVTIGSNVKVIGNKAFNSCKKLKTVIIKSAIITKFGKASFKGIKKKATFKVPKSKKKSYKKMIKKAGAKKYNIK